MLARPNGDARSTGVAASGDGSPRTLAEGAADANPLSATLFSVSAGLAVAGMLAWLWTLRDKRSDAGEVVGIGAWTLAAIVGVVWIVTIPGFWSFLDTGPTSEARAGEECAEGYDVCLDPAANDYDCSSGEGDGPEYVSGPVEVTGSDPFGLDRDGDGFGCDS